MRENTLKIRSARISDLNTRKLIQYEGGAVGRESSRDSKESQAAAQNPQKAQELTVPSSYGSRSESVVKNRWHR